MSFLEGGINFDLNTGISLNLYVKIVATKQPRRKVIVDVAKPDAAGPGMRIFLSAKNELIFGIRDKKGTEYETPPIGEDRFAGRPIWLRAEIRPLARAEAAEGNQLNLLVAVDDEVVAESQAIGDFAEDVTGRQAVGSALGGVDSATFDLAELVVTSAPLTDRDRAHMASYFAERYGYGRAQK